MPGIRTLIVCFLLSAVMLPATVSTAQDDVSLSIAYVNLSRVLQEAEPIRTRIDTQERKLLNLQNQIEGLLGQHQKLRANLQRQQSVLSEAQVQDRMTEISDLRETITQLQQEAQGEIKNVEQDIIDPFVQTVVSVTRSLAKEEGIDLVLRSEQLIYGSEPLDITDKVIEAVEAEFEKREAESESVPAPPADSSGTTETGSDSE